MDLFHFENVDNIYLQKTVVIQFVLSMFDVYSYECVATSRVCIVNHQENVNIQQ